VSDDTQREDLTILALLDSLQEGAEDGLPTSASAAGGDEAGETLARLYTEVLGLIPLELAPAAPSPGVRERILALVTDETQEIGAPLEAAAAPPGRPTRVAPPAISTAPSGPVAPAVAASTAPSAPVFPAFLPPPRARRWPLGLAAALILALLGTSFWLWTGVQQQGVTIDRLAQELASEKSRVAELTREHQQAATQLAALQSNFGLVTSPAVEISPMKPVGASPQPQARGVLWVAADHQHWYLAVHDLQPLGEGRRYNLWFVADAGTVNGGTFDAQPGAPVNLSSEHMPAGTKAVVITLEPAQGAPAPSGPEVLRATGKIQIL